MNPVIVGAGPVGCYFAKKLIEKEIKPIILEEHKEVGKPLHCTGIVSPRLLNIINLPKDIILNKPDKLHIFSKNNDCIVNGNALVINRIKFDKFLAKGLNVKLNTRFLSYERKNKEIIVKTNKGNIKTKLLVIANGASSNIINDKNDFIIGIQARIKMKHDNSVEMHFGYIPDFFAWVVPEGKSIFRIGLAGRFPVKYFNSFVKKFKGKIINKQAGLIPMYYPKKFYDDNVIAIGDSAGQVKATTGGGIVTGLLSAEIAANAVIKAYKENDFSSGFWRKNYYNIWKKTVGKELKMHYLIRKALNKFNEKDYDKLVNFAKENKFLFEKYGDMDFPTRYFFKLLKPKNIGFMLRFLSCLI